MRSGRLIVVMLIAVGGHCAASEDPQSKVDAAVQRLMIQQKNTDELKVEKTFALGGDPDCIPPGSL